MIAGSNYYDAISYPGNKNKIYRSIREIEVSILYKHLFFFKYVAQELLLITILFIKQSDLNLKLQPIRNLTTYKVY